MREKPPDLERPGSTLGERIKSIRLNWHWSQTELAETLGVDQASISFWERDKITPCGSAIVGLASLFRTSPDALVEGWGFRIPEAPSDPGTPKADRAQPRSVCLPLEEEGGIMVVDLGDGSSREKVLSEALMSLAEGSREHRRVWIVLG